MKNKKAEFFKLVGVVVFLIVLMLGWYTFFPDYASFSWFFSVIIMTSVLGKDFKFF
jgi:hypothetical protein